MQNAGKRGLRTSFLLFAALIIGTCFYSTVAQVGLPQPNGPANKAPVPNKLPPKPQPPGDWSYTFARSAESALDAINGGSTNQTIRDPYISISVKNGQPIYHIFFHPKYVGNTPWKWQTKQINKLNEVIDFLSYKNSYKNEPLHTQAKVVMVTVGNQNTFYIFYVSTSAAAFGKPSWEAFFTPTIKDVEAGVNQSSVGSDGIPVDDFEISGTDKGFYYFYPSAKTKGSSKWGWARAETPEGALKFLNTKYSNQSVKNACIAAVQEPAQVVFYVFYR